MDELRQETMLPTTAAFAALKQPGGRGGGSGGAAMRAKKPEKMVAEMQPLELIDELKTRKNGDDMSWDGFKPILGRKRKRKYAPAKIRERIVGELVRRVDELVECSIAPKHRAASR